MLAPERFDDCLADRADLFRFPRDHGVREGEKLMFPLDNLRAVAGVGSSDDGQVFVGAGGAQTEQQRVSGRSEINH